jgi:PAS domain S-box-containing protein/putative nucleotidyltransferase with HDIG domain
MKVLVVDDSEDNLNIFSTILERKGYEVTTASNGQDALDILSKTPVDLILSDILMPVMDGFSLLRECRSSARLRKIPFVFITGAFLDKKDEDLAFELGVSSFVRKPVGPDELIQAVETAIATKKTKKRIGKPSAAKEAIDKQFSSRIMEKLKARMQELEEEIADRKKAEGALKQAESEYRLLFDTMAQGVVYHDAAGYIVAANAAAERILGLSNEELLGRTCYDPRWKSAREDGSDFPSDEHPVTVALKTGQPVYDTVMGIHNPRDDRFHWIKISAIPQLKPEEDTPYQVYATFDDVTDQFLAFKAVQEQEARQNALLENTTDPIWSIDSAHRLIAMNSTGRQYFSAVAGPIEIGQDVLEGLTDDKRRFWETIFERAIKGERLTFEVNYKVDGKALDIDFSANPITSVAGNVTGISFFGRDVTERKKTDAALRESEERYRTLIEKSAEAIMVVQKGRIVFARSGPSPVSAYTGDELIGKNVSDLIYPADYTAVATTFASRKTGYAVKNYAFRVIDKSGATRWVEAHTSDITWEGRPAALIFQTDITEHKQLEDAIRKTNRLYKTLHQCNEAVVLASSENQMMQDVCSVLVETGGYRMAWVGFAENDDRKTVRPVAQCGFSEGYLESIDVTWEDDEHGRGPTGTAIRTGKTVVIQNIADSPDYAPWLARATEQGFAAVIALPLNAYWQTIGSLNLYSASVDSFDRDEIDLLEQLAADLSYGITSLRERKQREEAEIALSSSEQRFRKAVQSTTDIVWDWDIKSGRLEWYGDIDKMLGYGQAELPRTRSAWENLLHPDDRDNVTIALNKLAQTGTPYSIEYRISCKNGAARIWVDRGLVVRDREGNIIRAVGACVDITDHRHEEEQGRRRRDLAVALAAAPDLKTASRLIVRSALEITGMEGGAIYLLDEKTGDFNLAYGIGGSKETAEKYAVFEAGSAVERFMSEAVPTYEPADQFTPPLDYVYRECGYTFAASIPVMHEARVVACLTVDSKTHTEMPELVRSTLEALAAHLGGAIERIQSREALLSSEEQFRFIADRTKDVIWALDKDLHYIYVSPSVTAQRGYTVEEAMQLNLAQVATPESLERIVNTILGNIPAETTAGPAAPTYKFTGDMELHRKDGSTFWSEESVTVLFTSDGKLNGLLGISRDITERKQLEAELRQKDAMFRVVFDHHYQFTGLLDPDGRMLTANNTALQFAGVEEKDIIGKYFWETPWWRHSSEIRLQLKAAVEKAAGGEFAHLDTSNVNAAGEIHLIDVTLNPVFDESGKVIYIVPEGRDITDVMKAQQSLRESEEKYRKVVEVTYDAIAVAQDGRLKFFNHRVTEMTGYTAEELQDMPFINLVYPEDRDMIADRYRKRLAGETIEAEYSFRHVKKDGTVGWAEINIALIDWDGQPATLSSLKDVTERKTAEDALRDSEEKYRLVVESAREGIFVAQDAHLKFFNSRVPQISGYTLEELKVTPFTEIIHPLDRQMVIDKHLRRLKGEVFTDVYPFRVVTSDGRTVWVEVTAVLIDWEGKPATLNFISDITERRQAEDSLKGSEEKYRTMLESMDEGYYEIDANGNYTFFNDALVKELGYSREELLGLNYKSYIPPEDIKRVVEIFSEVYRTGVPRHWVPLTNIRKDGTRIYLEDSIYPLKNEAGEIIGLRGLGRDVTERRKSEEALQMRALLLDSTYDSVIAYEPDGKMIYVNDAAASSRGFSCQEMLKMNIRELIPERNLTVFDDRLQKIIETGGLSFEAIHVRKDGTEFDVEAQARQLEIAGHKIVVVVYRDISERKKSESALRDSEQRFRSLFVHNPIAVYSQDTKGNFLSVNDATLAMTGYTREEFLAMRPEQFTVPEDWEETRKRFLQAAHGQPETYEISIIVKNGEHKCLNVTNIGAVVDSNIVGVYSIAEDITDRKRIQAALQESMATITSTLEGTMEAVATMSELRDPYTAGHQKMVTQLALAIGRELGIDEERLRGLRVAGLLHDVGKVHVPSEILSKPGKLSELEKGLAKAHAVAGFDIVKAIKFPWPVAEMIHQHHERLDGSGYPRGLKGEEIMLEARILAVADTVEAMMSHRPYRPALGLDKALEEISQNRGRLYGEAVVDACVRLFKEKNFAFAE